MFREMFTISQVSPTVFALFLADTCDTILSRITGWAEPMASLAFRRALLLKITTAVEDALYAFSADSEDYTSLETIILRMVETDSVEYLYSTVKYPPDYYLTIAITVSTSGSTTTLNIEMKEYSPIDVLKYTISESQVVLTAPFVPDDITPLIQDNTTMTLKIKGAFAQV